MVGGPLEDITLTLLILSSHSLPLTLLNLRLRLPETAIVWVNV